MINEILNKLSDVNGRPIPSRYNEKYLIKHFPEYYKYINESTSFLTGGYTFKEKIQFIKEEITYQPVCKCCGTPTTFKEGKLSLWCSAKCYNSDKDFAKDRLKNVDHSKANETRRNTMRSKYGVEFNSQRLEVKDLISNSKSKAKNDDELKCLLDRDWVEREYIQKKRTLVDIADELGVYYGTVGSYISKLGYDIRQTTVYSRAELKLQKFLDDHGIKYIQNSKKILESGLELDIYIPDYNLAIEINGVYWHSYPTFETSKQKSRHLDKTNECRDQNIQLLQFWDTEIDNQFEIVTNIILAKLGKLNQVYARKCELREVPQKESKDFLNKYHIQGNCNSSVRVGLYYENELVLLMTFGRNRFTKDDSYELIRLCSKSGINVVGGASKCLSYFKSNYSFTTLYSFCDKRLSVGNVYNALGFKSDGVTSPGYFWVEGGVKIHNRINFQKHKLKSILENYNEDLSEAENMFNNKYRRLWDCGHYRFKLTF